jgi:hypothetical protein
VVLPNFYFAGIYQPGIDGTPISVANLLEKYIDENATSLTWNFHINPH